MKSVRKNKSDRFFSSIELIYITTPMKYFHGARIPFLGLKVWTKPPFLLHIFSLNKMMWWELLQKTSLIQEIVIFVFTICNKKKKQQFTSFKLYSRNFNKKISFFSSSYYKEEWKLPNHIFLKKLNLINSFHIKRKRKVS